MLREWRRVESTMLHPHCESRITSPAHVLHSNLRRLRAPGSQAETRAGEASRSNASARRTVPDSVA